MFVKSSILLSFAVGVYADLYSLAATIAWAPAVPSSVDQSLVFNSTYYLADRTNKGIHVISLTNNTQTAFISGFVTGLVNGTLTSSISGPDGMIVLPNRNELYVGDGDGSIKVISLFTNTIIANISTGSKKRADEFAYDPTSRTVIVTNPNEETPIVTIINATSRAVLGNVTFTGATGLEQPAFNPADSKFYISVPSTTNAQSGAVQVISTTPGTLSITKTLPVPNCAPAGIVFGASNMLFIACSSDQVKSYGISASYIMDVTSGSIVSNISNLTGTDQVAYSSKTGYFYASAYLNTVKGQPAPLLAVVAANGTILQTIVTDNVTAHAVAVDNTSGNMIVPVKSKGVLVYSMNVTTTKTSASGSATPSSTSASGAMARQVLSMTGLVAAIGVSCLFLL